MIKKTFPIVRQKHKFELQKEVEDLKKRNLVLANNQKPLPDNVEDVQYEPATGTFKGQSTGKDYHGMEAVKMNEQYDRISLADKNLLKRMELIKYQNNELKEKPLWLEKEEEHNKKLKHFGIEHSQKKEPGYPKLTNLPVVNRNINQKPQRRDTWKEFTKTGKLPILSKQEIEDVRGNKRVRDYMINEDKKEKKKFADEVSKEISSVHRSRLAEEDKKQKRIKNHTLRQWGIQDVLNLPNQDLKTKMRVWIIEADNEKKQELNKPQSTPEKPVEHFVLPSQRVTPVALEDTQSLNQRLRNNKITPGLSPELLGLQKQINRNVDYVLGADQKDNLESRNKETTKEETFD